MSKETRPNSSRPPKAEKTADELKAGPPRSPVPPLPPPPKPRRTFSWPRFLVKVAPAVIIAALLLFAYFPGRSLKSAATAHGLEWRNVSHDRRNISLRVYKGQKRLEVLFKGDVIKTYRVSTGPGIPAGSKVPRPDESRLLSLLRGFWYFPGDKREAGDLRTPEGDYYLATSFHPSENTYRFALLSYPDAAHRQRSRNPGDNVGIHGIAGPLNWLGRLHTLIRHTEGCIALNNGQVDELASVAGKGTPVQILP